MMKKISKLLVVTIVALFMWIGTPNAIRLTMDEITDEVLEANPDVSYIYIIGKHIFTDKSMPLSLADFMLAARTIDVSSGSGNIKGDPIYDEMSTLLYEPEYNDDYTEIVGFSYGDMDLTGKGTPKDTYDIEYIDYHKLTEKNSVTFDVDGVITTQRIENGKTITEPKAPTKEGYKFLGWYVSGTNNIFNFNTPITNDLKLEAKFEINKYDVVLKLDDGSTYNTFTVEHGKTITEPKVPTKEDYEFLGWFIGENKYDFSTIVTSNVELVGKYRALVKPSVTTTIKDVIRGEAQEFEITIKANDYAGKNVKQTLEFSGKRNVDKIEYYDGTKWEELSFPFLSSTITIPKSVFELKDATYKFRITWSRNSDNEIVIKLTDNDSGKTYAEISKNIVVANKSYTVTFNNDSEVTTSEVVEGAKVTPPTPKEKAGYDFIGWYNGDTKFDLETPITTDITLTAKYDLKTYVVKYLVDETTFLETNVKHGEKATAPTEKPTKIGYTFKNWTLNNATYDFNKTVTGDLTLTASFTINTYTVTFKNENTIVATKKVNYNSTTTAPTSPTKTGYTFDGWYNGDTKFENTTKITDNVTYTAKFNINTYTVTFKNGEEVVETKKVDYNKTTTAPTSPTKTGYDFSGWYNGDTKFEANTTKITGNVTYTAKFTKKVFTITFDSQGGSSVDSVKVQYNETLSSLPTTSRAGYKFLGWYDGTTKVTTSTKFTANKTLKAKWEENNEPVTDKNKMAGTYISDNEKFKLITTAASTGIKFEVKLTSQDLNVVSGTLIVKGNKAQWDGISIEFYETYAVISLSGEALTKFSPIAGTYLKQ